jgi:phage shock protein A
VAEARRQFSQAASPTATGFEIVSRFERLRARVAAAEAEADAWVELTAPQNETDAQTIEEIEDAAKIDRMLGELRSSL